MRRGRLFIYIGLILILGLVAVGVFFLRDQQQPQIPVGEEPIVTPEPPKVSVIVIAQPVQRGQPITEDVLAVVQISEEDILEGMVREEDMDEIIGSFARYDLDAGIYVTDGVLVDQASSLSSAGSDHAIFIPPGMVAVSIPVDRLSSVAYGVQRGDHVNVIVTLIMVDLDSNFQTVLPNHSSSILAPGPAVLTTVTNEQEGETTVASGLQISELIQTLTAQVVTGGSTAPMGRLELDQGLGQPFYVVPSGTQRPRLVSQTLIQNVIVLQMGEFSVDTPIAVATPDTGAEEVPQPEEQQPAEGEGETAAAAPVLPDTVTLIVSPQDAVTLNYLLLNGARLSLALRSAGDDSQVPTEAVTLQFLVDQYQIPVPSKLPYGLEPAIQFISPPICSVTANCNFEGAPTPEPQQ